MSSENAEPTTGNDTETAECRACLQKLDTEQLNNLFQAWTTSWEGMKSTIAEDLSELANIKVGDLLNICMPNVDLHKNLLSSVTGYVCLQADN